MPQMENADVRNYLTFGNSTFRLLQSSMFSSCYESRARLPAPCPAVKLTQFLRHISPASYNVFLNEPWVLLLEFSKHPDSVFGPFAQKHAIMKIGERRLAEFLERLVV